MLCKSMLCDGKPRTKDNVSKLEKNCLGTIITKYFVQLSRHKASDVKQKSLEMLARDNRINARNTLLIQSGYGC